jgi:hypothetical protein
MLSSLIHFGWGCFFCITATRAGGGRAIRYNVLASLRAFHYHPLLLRAYRPVALRALPCAFNWDLDVSGSWRRDH